MKYPPHQLQFVNLESTKNSTPYIHCKAWRHLFHTSLAHRRFFAHKSFTKSVMAHSFFSHTEITELHRIYPHGILCAPWILCETPHSRVFAHRQHRITQNLSAWHSVCSVNSVWNTTLKNFRTQIAQKFTRYTRIPLRMVREQSASQFCVFRGFCVKQEITFCEWHEFCVKHHTSICDTLDTRH